MYIRRTHTRSSSTGESYHTHRLVQSRRVGSQVRQETLLNLGRHFVIDQEQWPLLCSRIEEVMIGQKSLLPEDYSDLVEREAQRIVARLLMRQAAPTPSSESGAGSQEDIQSVDISTLELTRPRSVGVEHLGLWAMEQMRFLELLEKLDFTGPQQRAAMGLVIGRMAAPGSEQATHRWLRDQSGLGELLDADYETMSAMQLYRVSDLLVKNREEIEKQLFGRVKDLFGFACTVTLYDLTNTYFEGELSGNIKAQRGHSKEKRSDCPLLTLGLVLDGSGFVIRSGVFSGNVAESKTLEEMLQGLDTPEGALVVMDRGIATEANLSWLRDKKYRYLVVSREQRRQFDMEHATCIETATKQRVHIQKVPSPDGQEIRLYCHSERRAMKEDGITQRFAKRFEAELQKLHDGLARPRTTKAIDKLWERIGRLKEKCHGIGQHYQIDIIPDDNGKNATAIRWERKPMDGSLLTHPGVYCLRTNETGWDNEQLWRTYITLTDLESVFRSLKSELGLRPVFHHKEERSDGHLFITVLAYQFVQIIRRHLHTKGICERWSSLRAILAGQCRVTVTFRRSDGRTLHVRKATSAEPAQKKIYQAVDLNPSPGGVKKMII
ncbi:MAG: IS1634 family transposase [Magnetococcales bacterium]|nr:IS1634 family transposase [Magnetococcales bacterium]